MEEIPYRNVDLYGRYIVGGLREILTSMADI
jgi:hypothetical protein